MANRRTTKFEKWAVHALVRLWEIRNVLLLTVPYVFLLSWLFLGSSSMDSRPAEIFSVPESPVWAEPDSVHWFGTTGSGVDLFQLTRLAMGTSVAVAVVCSFFGIAVAMLIVSLFAFDSSEHRFRPIFVLSRAGFLLPAMAVLVIFAGGSGGSLPVAMLGIILVTSFYMAPMIAGWFDEGEKGSDVLAGFGLGLSRQDVLVGRVLPKVFRRLVGIFAQLVPVVILVEMALSFMGFTGDRLGFGAMIAYGQLSIIEAPWLAVCPGILASVVIVGLSLLGAMVAKVTSSGLMPRHF